MKNLRVKGKWSFAAVLVLLAVSVLAGTVYADTLDMADISPLAAKIGGESVGAVPEEAENAGYTRMLKSKG